MALRRDDEAPRSSGGGLLLAGVAVWCALGGPADSQPAAGDGAKRPSVLDLIPYVTPDQALASAHGQKLVDRLGAHWRANADTACMTEKRLTPEAFRALAAKVTLEVGRRTEGAMLQHTNAAAAETAFRNVSGDGAPDELRKLLGDPLVKRYVGLLAAAAAADLAQTYVLLVERTIRVANLQVRGDTHPVSTGKGELLREAEKLEKDAAGFVDANPSADLTRADSLMTSLGGAIIDAQDNKALAEVTPARMVDIVETQLVANCIVKL